MSNENRCRAELLSFIYYVDNPANKANQICGFIARDPVCQMQVEVVASTPSYRQDNQTYYFCSSHCFDQFTRKNKAKAAATAAQNYICPMHPQVVSDKFGTCPLCGMALEVGMANNYVAQVDLLEKADLEDWRRRFLLSLVFTVPLFFMAMILEHQVSAIHPKWLSEYGRMRLD